MIFGFGESKVVGGGGGGGGRGEIYGALECHAFVYAEKENNVAAGVEGVGEELCVFLLRRPCAVFLCFGDVAMVPAFDHKVAYVAC